MKKYFYDDLGKLREKFEWKPQLMVWVVIFSIHSGTNILACTKTVASQRKMNWSQDGSIENFLNT